MRLNKKPWGSWLLFAVSAMLYGVAVALVIANGLSSRWSDLIQLAFAVFTVMGILIAIRRPGHAIGRLFLIEGLLAAITFAGQQYGIWLMSSLDGEKMPGDLLWRIAPEYIASGFLWTVFFAIILLFPDGRLPSARWRPFAVVGGGLVLISFVFMLRPDPVVIDPALPTVDNPLAVPALAALNPFWDLVRFSTIFTGLGCLLAPVLRFRRAEGIARQQLKWLAFGALILMLVVAGFILTALVAPTAEVQAVFNMVATLSAGLIPVLMALAILNYRLYDIDIIIRRTLVYSILTALLALTYWGGVVILQSLLRPLTGEGNDLAVVATTLLVAAIFFPLRRVIQNLIDHRFFRRKYDAVRTLAAFAAHARDEVELERLTGRLVEVVDETMKPASMSLWLRPAVGPGEPAGRQQESA